MAIGKKELSAILLVFGVIISVYMALLAGPISAQNANIDITNGDTIIEDEFIDEQITVQEDEDLREDVIIDKPRRREPTIINIPNKPLPPTGGLPVYGMVAGFILAGVGLLGLGIGIRREQRR